MRNQNKGYMTLNCNFGLPLQVILDNLPTEPLQEKWLKLECNRLYRIFSCQIILDKFPNLDKIPVLKVIRLRKTLEEN